MNQIGVVTIGRNEGDRLVKCLQSLKAQLPPDATIIYVDSKSTDDSIGRAKSLNIEVVELDMTIPFTAGRARNVGFQRLIAIEPQLKYVQFVDGDCEISPGWLETATNTLDNDPEIVAVCGWRQEVYPDRSVL
jgi:glycosyltransferase involved in cell wall biosynthesis